VGFLSTSASGRVVVPAVTAGSVGGKGCGERFYPDFRDPVRVQWLVVGRRQSLQVYTEVSIY